MDPGSPLRCVRDDQRFHQNKIGSGNSMGQKFMRAIETMNLRELFELRNELWSDPSRIVPLIEASANFSGLTRFLAGQEALSRAFAAAVLKRLDIIERRLDALDGKS